MSQYDDLHHVSQSRMVQNGKMNLGIQDLYEISSTERMPLGSRVDLLDGRSFVYCKAGAADLAPGKLVQMPVPTEEDQATTVSAVVGDTFITATLDAAAAANAWQGGILYFNDDTGEPQMYTIRGHAAGQTGLKINLYERIRTACTAGSGTISIVPNPYKALIIHPSPPTACVIGVPVVSITAAYYGWVQVKGPCVVLANGTPAVNNTVEPSAAVDGAVDVTSETTLNAAVGIVMQTAVADTEYFLVNLDIPGF